MNELSLQGTLTPNHVTRLLTAILLLTALSLALPPVFAATEDFNVDEAHSFVNFKVKHQNVGYAFGRFNAFSGMVKLDQAQPSASSLEFSIKTASVDTANEGRDKHLRGPDFFDVKQFPVMTFKSTSSKKTGDNTYALTGDLTLKGVTKSITVPIEHIATVKTPRGTTAGAISTFTIKRSDFGMTYGLGSLGDDVEVTVALEAKAR